MSVAHGMRSGGKAREPNCADFQVPRHDTLQFSSIEGVWRMAGVLRPKRCGR
jgi:hypothetical protein